MTSSARLTPMLRHYLELKAEHRDAFLLYRMGDFYELFFEDAEQAAPILEITLTARHRGTDKETPMCGVPHHALEVYLGKLIRAGFKVAICDQVEEASAAKGLVKRAVTRVVTPGTLSDPELLDREEENYLASVVWNGDCGGGAFLDISTGTFFLRRWGRPEDTVEDLSLFRPSEVLYRDRELPEPILRWLEREGVCLTEDAERYATDSRHAGELLREQLGTASLKGFGLETDEPAVLAAAAAISYARDTQQSDLSHVRELRLRDRAEALLLDSTTVTNLEIFRSLGTGGRKGTLAWVLDQTVSPAGGRLLRDWLRRPLCDTAKIATRHLAVAELLERTNRRSRIRERLSGIGDPERILSRAVLGTVTPREVATLRDGLLEVPAVLAELGEARAPLLREMAAVDPAVGLATELERTLEATPPASVKEGGVIRSGVDAELDRFRSLAQDSKRHILAMEKAERDRTGIGSLKVRYNKVFGYYIEVTKANQDLVPEDYIRKQTLVNAERYITPALKELEEQILAAEEGQLALEEEHFRRLRASIVAAGPLLTPLAKALAELDVVACFAEVAAKNGYSRPRITAAGGPIVLKDSRHPVVERMGEEPFVPNDAELDPDESQIVVLTGPNMGGKSTYLRQVALIVLMAQAGSFVPASSASIGVVDRIFTRVGASDDLSRGESTFMVEMIETAKILRQSTAHSLVILDEVGRGTATFDGLSLAWAIVEHLHEHPRAKTLFATHYHELTELSALLPRVVNRTVAVKEWEDRIVFLRRVIPGSSNKSYGLHVARLAGVPVEVIDRAAEILTNLEEQEYDLSGKPRLAKGGTVPAPGPDQLNLFAPVEEVVASVLRDLDLERLSPLAALNLLQSLKSRLDVK